MEIRIRMSEGEMVTVHADPDQLAAAFADAVRSGGSLDVRGAGGRVLAINPAQVMWWERVPWEPDVPAPVRDLRAASVAG